METDHHSNHDGALSRHKWDRLTAHIAQLPKPPFSKDSIENILAIWLGLLMAMVMGYYCRNEMGYHVLCAAMVGILLGIALGLLLRFPFRFVLRAIFWVLQFAFFGGAMAAVGWLIWKAAVSIHLW